MYYRNGSTFSANVRDSPDLANLPIGEGPLGGDFSDLLKGVGVSELEDGGRHMYNPWLNRILEHPTS